MTDIDTNRFRDQLIAVVIEGLHYIDNIEVISTLRTAQQVTDAIAGARNRYLQDRIFHAKVESMVASIYQATDLPALLDAADERDGFKQEIGYLRGEVDRLKAENEKLNKLRVHCENCGGDYAATGLEVGCNCTLKAENERLRKKDPRFIDRNGERYLMQGGKEYRLLDIAPNLEAEALLIRAALEGKS